MIVYSRQHIMLGTVQQWQGEKRAECVRELAKQQERNSEAFRQRSILLTYRGWWLGPRPRMVCAPSGSSDCSLVVAQQNTLPEDTLTSSLDGMSRISFRKEIDLKLKLVIAVDNLQCIKWQKSEVWQSDLQICSLTSTPQNNPFKDPSVNTLPSFVNLLYYQKLCQV